MALNLIKINIILRLRHLNIMEKKFLNQRIMIRYVQLDHLQINSQNF